MYLTKDQISDRYTPPLVLNMVSRTGIDASRIKSYAVSYALPVDCTLQTIINALDTAYDLILDAIISASFHASSRFDPIKTGMSLFKIDPAITVSAASIGCDIPGTQIVVSMYPMIFSLSDVADVMFKFPRTGRPKTGLECPLDILNKILLR